MMCCVPCSRNCNDAGSALAGCGICLLLCAVLCTAMPGTMRSFRHSWDPREPASQHSWWFAMHTRRDRRAHPENQGHQPLSAAAAIPACPHMHQGYANYQSCLLGLLNVAQPSANNHWMDAAVHGEHACVLQDMLAMRKTVGTLTGTLLVNGCPASPKFISSTSYVPQVGCDNPATRQVIAEVLRVWTVARLIEHDCLHLPSLPSAAAHATIPATHCASAHIRLISITLWCRHGGF